MFIGPWFLFRSSTLTIAINTISRQTGDSYREEFTVRSPHCKTTLPFFPLLLVFILWFYHLFLAELFCITQYNGCGFFSMCSLLPYLNWKHYLLLRLRNRFRHILFNWFCTVDEDMYNRYVKFLEDDDVLWERNARYDRKELFPYASSRLVLWMEWM